MSLHGFKAFVSTFQPVCETSYKNSSNLSSKCPTHTHPHTPFLPHLLPSIVFDLCLENVFKVKSFHTSTLRFVKFFQYKSNKVTPVHRGLKGFESAYTSVRTVCFLPVFV